MAEDQNRSLNDKFALRMPDGMRGRIKIAATNNNRSMNAEIVATLEEKYPDPEDTMEAYMFQYLKELQNASSNDERVKISSAMKRLLLSWKSGDIAKSYIMLAMIGELQRHGISTPADDKLMASLDKILKSAENRLEQTDLLDE